MTRLPPTPDFDTYAVPADIRSVTTEKDGRVLRLAWSDGRSSRFHAIWLRDNSCDPGNLNLETRETTVNVTALPTDPRVVEAHIDAAGALAVRWSPGASLHRFHPGWLYAHDYSNGAQPHDPGVVPVAWDATLAEPPTFDGADILTDDTALEAWLKAFATYGIARLTGVGVEPGTVARVAARLGPMRVTNFGRIFEVRVQAGPGSNAYTALALPPHTDLSTRKYQPGLQFLHCLVNDSAGGEAIMVDGLALARFVAARDPEAYALLTTVRWQSSNRALDTDYRWDHPVIRLDDAGEVVELRVVPFLRAPLATDFDQVERAYASLRVAYEAAANPALQMRFSYRPGDLVAIDNRRVLHGREAHDPDSGERWLQGCYSEREELLSRLRILARQRRGTERAGR